MNLDRIFRFMAIIAARIDFHKQINRLQERAMMLSPHTCDEFKRTFTENGWIVYLNRTSERVLLSFTTKKQGTRTSQSSKSRYHRLHAKKTHVSKSRSGITPGYFFILKIWKSWTVNEKFLCLLRAQFSNYSTARGRRPRRRIDKYLSTNLKRW